MKKVTIFASGSFLDTHVIAMFVRLSFEIKIIRYSCIKPTKPVGAWPLQVSHKQISTVDSAEIASIISGSAVVLNMVTQHMPAPQSFKNDLLAIMPNLASLCKANGMDFFQLLPYHCPSNIKPNTVYYSLCTQDPIFDFISRFRIVPMCYPKDFANAVVRVNDIINGFEAIFTLPRHHGKSVLISGPQEFDMKRIIKIVNRNVGCRFIVKLPKFLAQFAYKVSSVLLPKYFTLHTISPEAIAAFYSPKANVESVFHVGAISDIDANISHTASIYKKPEIF